jgi:hypothetical protein
MSKTKVLYVEDELFLGKIVKKAWRAAAEVIMKVMEQKQRGYLKIGT